MTTYRTRADLMAHPAFADLNTDSDGNPCVWLNTYKCPDCGAEWEDRWSSQCDDDCGECGTTCAPEESLWNGPDDDARDMWESLPEGEGQGWGASVMPDGGSASHLDTMIEAAARITDPTMSTVEVYAYLSSLRPDLRLEFHGADAEGRWIINATGGKAIMRRATVTFEPNTLW